MLRVLRAPCSNISRNAKRVTLTLHLIEIWSPLRNPPLQTQTVRTRTTTHGLVCNPSMQVDHVDHLLQLPLGRCVLSPRALHAALIDCAWQAPPISRHGGGRTSLTGVQPIGNVMGGTSPLACAGACAGSSRCANGGSSCLTASMCRQSWYKRDGHENVPHPIPTQSVHADRLGVS